jgi:hypothetical protein
MRAIVLLIVLALPIAAHAQPERRQGQRPSRAEHVTPQPPPPRAEPTPQIGSPLVPAGWQWFGESRSPSIGNPYLPAGRQWFGSPDDGRRRPGHGGLYPRPWWPYGYGAYVGDGYYNAEPQEETARFAAPPPPLPATGLLRLDITPSTGLQYYVDGLLIGSSSELGTEFEINAGARRIEIRAAGYRPLVFDARINEGRITTFRGALERLQEEAPPAPPSGSRTLYIIRGCYIGNMPPQQADLPKGCDIKRMTTR